MENLTTKQTSHLSPALRAILSKTGNCTGQFRIRTIAVSCTDDKAKEYLDAYSPGLCDIYNYYGGNNLGKIIEGCRYSSEDYPYQVEALIGEFYEHYDLELPRVKKVRTAKEITDIRFRWADRAKKRKRAWSMFLPNEEELESAN